MIPHWAFPVCTPPDALSAVLCLDLPLPTPGRPPWTASPGFLTGWLLPMGGTGRNSGSGEEAGGKSSGHHFPTPSSSTQQCLLPGPSVWWDLAAALPSFPPGLLPTAASLRSSASLMAPNPANPSLSCLVTEMSLLELR